MTPTDLNRLLTECIARHDAWLTNPTPENWHTFQTARQRWLDAQGSGVSDDVQLATDY